MPRGNRPAGRGVLSGAALIGAMMGEVMMGQPKQRGRGLRPGNLLAGAAAAALTGYGIYALWQDPMKRLRIARWRIFRPEWAGRDPVRLVVISDLHAGASQINLDRISRIVARANAQMPDVAVVLGDLAVAHPFRWGGSCRANVAGRLAAFKGRLGRFAVLGNQGWWHNSGLHLDHCGPISAGDALEDVGFRVLDNQVQLIGGAERGFILAGLGDPHLHDGTPRRDRVGDLADSIAGLGRGAPVVLLSHEPDIFSRLDRLHHRISVQISAHRHGGWVRHHDPARPVLTSDNENYSWGRYDENGRTLIVSGGIDCAVRPMKAGCMPEITVIEIAPAPHF